MKMDNEKPQEVDIYKKLNAFKPLSKKLKKHDCKDCFNCLFCSETRCKVCIANKKQDKE